MGEGGGLNRGCTVAEEGSEQVKAITLSYLEQQVRRLDPSLTRDDRAFETALILLASAVEGPSIERIAYLTNIPRSRVAERGRRLRKNRVWSGNRVVANWFDKESGGIAFWLDVLVADGFMARA